MILNPQDLKRFVQRVARRFGAQLSSIDHAGIDISVDIDRIRPFRDFKTIVDVGAHSGESTREFRRRAPSAKIFAVEPVGENYAELAKNTSGDVNVTTVHAALSNTEGEAIIKYGASSLTGTLAYGAATTATPVVGEPVRVTTLVRLMADHGIKRVDFLKTDTEGHDIEVIKGAEGLMRDNKIDFVFSEVTFVDELVQTPFAEMHDLLRSSGFNLVGLYDIAIANSPLRIEFCNALFSRI